MRQQNDQSAPLTGSTGFNDLSSSGRTAPVASLAEFRKIPLIHRARANDVCNRDIPEDRDPPCGLQHSDAAKLVGEWSDTGGAPEFSFRLDIFGSRSQFNLYAVCLEYLPVRHRIEIFDVSKDPNRALTDRISPTPNQVKTAPAPASSIVGTLSPRETVLQVLGIPKLPP